MEDNEISVSNDVSITLMEGLKKTRLKKYRTQRLKMRLLYTIHKKKKRNFYNRLIFTLTKLSLVQEHSLLSKVIFSINKAFTLSLKIYMNFCKIE